MLVKWFLDYILIVFSDVRLHSFSNRILHKQVKVYFPDCKCLHKVYGLIKELGALIAQTRIIVDGADNFFSL